MNYSAINESSRNDIAENEMNTLLTSNRADFKLYSMENVDCYYSKSINWCHDTLVNIGETSLAVISELPLFQTTYSAGTYVFVKLNGNMNSKDAYFDNLRPWKGNMSSTKTEYLFINDKKVKLYRAVHPVCECIRRKIFSINDLVIYCYMFDDEIKLPLERNGRLFNKPSTLDIVKETVQFRNFKGAEAILKLAGIDVNSKAICNIISKSQTSIKSNVGPVRFTGNKIMDTIVKLGGSLNVKTDNGKPLIVACVVFTNAIRIFGNECPTKEELEKFHILTKESIAKGSYNNLLQQEYFNNSCMRYGLENQISYDTTFDVSHLYLTLVIGRLGTFKTRASGKDRPIVLAAMVHTNKDKAAHLYFGEYFSSQWNLYNKGKVVPSLVKDGEAALNYFSQGPEFAITTFLGCDLHLKENLLGRKEVKEELYALFGLPQGTQLMPGLFNSLTLLEFEKRLQRIKDRFPDLYKKIEKQKIFLFRRHSGLPKALSGFGGRFCTTNSSESYNNIVSKYISGRFSGDVILEKIHNLHLDESKQLTLACSDKSNIIIFKERENVSWSQPKSPHNIIDKRRLLHFIPEIIYKNLLEHQKDNILKGLKDLSVSRSTQKNMWFVCSTSDDTQTVKIAMKNNLLLCNSHHCKISKRIRILPCNHRLAVINKYQLEDVWEFYKNIWKNTSLKSAQRAHFKKSDGSKRRKGAEFSKGNYKRNIYEYSESFLSASIASNNEESSINDASMDSTFNKDASVNKEEYSTDASFFNRSSYTDHDYSMRTS